MSEGMVRPVRWLTFLLLCWLVLMAGGCAPQPDVIATDDDNGGQVQVRNGQLFDIVLADDYDQTGCQWRKEHNSAPDVVEYLGQLYQPARKPPAGNGNGTNTMRYRAQQTGTAQVSLVESDNGDRVCRRYAVTVTVGPQTLWDGIASGAEYVLPYAAAVVVMVTVFGLIGRLVYLLVRRRRG
ncbi:protease inhibitor I42 family protein [Mycobacterium sp. 134]|uniref:protease inhibitor I42 family protein n=1 Tax=Mycobacterium sp. 134 TaxID=3400425 RepID=UPI003AAB8A46